MPSSLTLVIPDLFARLRGLDPLPRLPHLQTLLARGTRSTVAETDYAARLFACFGVATEGDLPVGAVQRLGDGGVRDAEWWYRAAPVHFLADRDRLHVIAVEADAHETQAFIQLFNDHFAADGWHLEASAPDRWYLRAPGPQRVRTVPLQQACGSDLRGALPSGDGALPWHRFLNEVQMLFHTIPCNAAREERGAPPINGLWAWGGGPLPAITRCFDQVWSDEPLARGLALLSGVTPQRPTLPLRFPAARTLMVLAAEPAAAWWTRADEALFTPACNALRAGALGQLTLEDGAGHALCVARADLRRWWRRRALVRSL